MSINNAHEQKREAQIKQFRSGKLKVEHRKQASKSEHDALVAEFKELKAADNDKWESMTESAFAIEYTRFAWRSDSNNASAKEWTWPNRIGWRRDMGAVLILLA